jgi:hypothetical protein
MTQPPAAPDGVSIRPANLADFESMLRLNAAWVRFTSPLSHDSLARLHDQSAYHRVVEAGGRMVAFLLALRAGADYDSPNYRWFEARGGAFLYIDRVIVDQAAQRCGIARTLYDGLLAFAARGGIVRVTCEVDIEPANEPSHRFHEGYGFREVGTQWVAGGTKRVSLRELRLRRCDRTHLEPAGAPDYPGGG